MFFFKFYYKVSLTYDKATLETEFYVKDSVWKKTLLHQQRATAQMQRPLGWELPCLASLS